MGSPSVCCCVAGVGVSATPTSIEALPSGWSAHRRVGSFAPAKLPTRPQGRAAASAGRSTNPPESRAVLRRRLLVRRNGTAGHRRVVGVHHSKHPERAGRPFRCGYGKFGARMLVTAARYPARSAFARRSGPDRGWSGRAVDVWGRRYAGGPRVAWVASVAWRPLRRELDAAKRTARSGVEGRGAVDVVTGEW